MSPKHSTLSSSLEHRLAELDFSDESRIRESLGDELSQKCRFRENKHQEGLSELPRWKIFFKPLPAFVLGLMSALALMGAANPDVWNNIVKIFKVGDHTEIVQSGTIGETEINSLLDDFDRDLEAGKSFFLFNDYGGWSGAVPRGGDPFIKQLASLSLTASLVNYPLQVPGFSSESNPVASKFEKALILPDDMAILFFGVGNLETILTQMPVGKGVSLASSSVDMTTSQNGSRTQTGTMPQLETLKIAGKTITWQVHDENTRNNLGTWARKYPEKEIGKFIWENDGMSFTLDGQFLTKETGIKIIESIRPYKQK